MAALHAMQGSKVQLEFWKVKEDDPRWLGQSGDFHPSVFNPDRHALQALQALQPFCTRCSGLVDNQSGVCSSEHGFTVLQLKVLPLSLPHHVTHSLFLNMPPNRIPPFHSRIV